MFLCIRIQKQYAKTIICSFCSYANCLTTYHVKMDLQKDLYPQIKADLLGSKKTCNTSEEAKPPEKCHKQVFFSRNTFRRTAFV